MSSQAISAHPRGALARCCPWAPGGRSQACGKPKAGIKMVGLKEKKKNGMLGLFLFHPHS